VTTTGFASIILDVDSTLCGIEGIDWLSGLRGGDAAEEVTALTKRAMAGEIALDAVYGERLALVRPTRDDVAALAREYETALDARAASVVRTLHEAGRRIVLVSGGIREAILPVARRLGVTEGDVHAVSVRFDAFGAYAGFDDGSPLTMAAGKRAVATALALPSRVLAMGDGATDAAMRPAVDAFAAYTGFVRRESVVSQADFVVESFDQLVEIVLG
jgi:phosphoserine phosphatase